MCVSMHNGLRGGLNGPVRLLTCMVKLWGRPLQVNVNNGLVLYV